VRDAEGLRAHAESIASEVEPQLSLAVDAVLPKQALRASLKALSHELGRRIWRFADMSMRLEYLLGAFGLCYMPAHLVDAHITAGRLKRLDIAEHRGREFSFPLHVMHERRRPPGRAGRWLIAELRRQLPIACPQLAPSRSQ
jgi:DNA-binding transcriptional LysR family regulator